MTAPQRPATNSDARKRAEEWRDALANAWDQGATLASPYGGAYLRSLLIENPYRSES